MGGCYWHICAMLFNRVQMRVGESMHFSTWWQPVKHVLCEYYRTCLCVHCVICVYICVCAFFNNPIMGIFKEKKLSCVQKLIGLCECVTRTVIVLIPSIALFLESVTGLPLRVFIPHQWGWGFCIYTGMSSFFLKLLNTEFRGYRSESVSCRWERAECGAHKAISKMVWM